MLARYDCPIVRRTGEPTSVIKLPTRAMTLPIRVIVSMTRCIAGATSVMNGISWLWFDEATSGRDQTTVDETLSKVDRQAPVILASASDYAAMQPERRYAALLIAMDNIRDARYGLDRANGQGGSAFEVRRREHELLRACEAYMRLVRT